MKSFRAENIKKQFGRVIALKGANFRFEGSKVTGLVGVNGCGKSTFAKICAGIIKKDEGAIYIDDERVTIDSPQQGNSYGIVLAHQNLSLIPDLTVWQNIVLGREARFRGIFLNNKEAKAASREILNDLVPGEIDIDQTVSTLKPAHQQMVEIAKALFQEPKMLILDEATACLDHYHVEQLFKKIDELKKRNVSIIFISHRLWEVNRVCNHVLVFRNGETVGAVDFQHEKRDERLIVSLMTGKEQETVNSSTKRKSSSKNAELLLELKNVSLADSLRNINLQLSKGEILGIGGLHGQGQEELIMLLAGSLRKTEGKIYLNKKEIDINHPRDAIRNGIYLVPGDRQRDGLFMIHSIFNNTIFPRFCLKSADVLLRFAKLGAITDRIISRSKIVPVDRQMVVKNLSGGNQQKVVFGRWLQFEPKILLLNDPVKGIDLQAKDALYKTMHELTDSGTAVILYASTNEELIEHCDRVLMMFEEQIVDEYLGADICDEKLIKSSLRVRGSL